MSLIWPFKPWWIQLLLHKKEKKWLISLNDQNSLNIYLKLRIRGFCPPLFSSLQQQQQRQYSELFIYSCSASHWPCLPVTRPSSGSSDDSIWLTDGEQEKDNRVERKRKRLWGEEKKSMNWEITWSEQRKRDEERNRGQQKRQKHAP